jgi:flagellar biosynthesis/type III secretory pathway protein FliH
VKSNRFTPEATAKARAALKAKVLRRVERLIAGCKTKTEAFLVGRRFGYERGANAGYRRGIADGFSRALGEDQKSA